MKMPCLILCGHPCSGKTRLAELIRDRALARGEQGIRKVIIVNESIACPDQSISACYETSHSEKGTRGALKSAFDRCVRDDASSTLVILDSLNYIKGFRYELFCISKAANQKHGVVWVLNESKLCKEWNQQRRAQSQQPDSFYYSDSLMDELILRFEPPDARNRWDNPLYPIDVRPPGVKLKSGLAKDALERSVYNMHTLSDAIEDTATTTTKKVSTTFKRAGFKKKAVRPTRETENVCAGPVNETPAEEAPKENAALDTEMKEQTVEEQIDQMLDSFLLDVEPLKQGISTQQHVSSDANVLHEVDSVTQQVCSLIATAQNKSTTASGRLSITLNNDKEPIWFDFHRRIALPELRRLRRQYIQWAVVVSLEQSCLLKVTCVFLLLSISIHPKIQANTALPVRSSPTLRLSDSLRCCICGTYQFTLHRTYHLGVPLTSGRKVPAVLFFSKWQGIPCRHAAHDGTARYHSAPYQPWYYSWVSVVCR